MWAKGPDTSKMPLDFSRRIDESVRAGVIDHARLHYDRSGHLEFVPRETGVGHCRTRKEEFDKVAGHNEQLDRIDPALRGS